MTKPPFLKCTCGAVAWDLDDGFFRCPKCEIAPNSPALLARTRTKRERKKAYRARRHAIEREKEYIPGPYPAIRWS